MHRQKANIKINMIMIIFSPTPAECTITNFAPNCST